MDQNQVILGIGYNGFPRGCADGELPWSKKHADGPLGTKYPYVVHAEANALLNKNAASVMGAVSVCGGGKEGRDERRKKLLHNCSEGKCLR